MKSFNYLNSKLMDPDNDPDPECIKPNDDFFGVDTTLY